MPDESSLTVVVLEPELRPDWFWRSEYEITSGEKLEDGRYFYTREPFAASPDGYRW